MKALICLGVHFYMVQYFPVNALTTEWYYSLSIIRRYLSLCPTSSFMPCHLCGRGVSLWRMPDVMLNSCHDTPIQRNCGAATCRAAVMWIVTVIYRFKYYFAWAVSESALIFGGFCFNGWDEKGDARWDRYSNTRISHVEFATSAAELPAHWNTCTGNFLRRCKFLTDFPPGICST